MGGAAIAIPLIIEYLPAAIALITEGVALLQAHQQAATLTVEQHQAIMDHLSALHAAVQTGGPLPAPLVLKPSVTQPSVTTGPPATGPAA